VLNGAGTAIARDAHGNAVGGIRTPAVDVPISTLSGVFDPHKSIICALFGSAAPFSPTTLRMLYPTHQAYVAQVRADAARAVRRGYLLAPDAAVIVDRARSAAVPG
jgi:hypothetical protein